MIHLRILLLWLLLILLQEKEVSAVNILRAQINKRFSCEREPIPQVVPFLLADKCTRISSDVTMKYDCQQNQFHVFTDSDCTEEMSDYDYVECFAGVLDRELCDEYPANMVVNYQVGQSCNPDHSDELEGLAGESAYVLDTCLKYDLEGSVEGSYRLIYSNSEHSELLFQVFPDSIECNGDFVYDTFKVGECKMSLIGTFGAPQGRHFQKPLAVKFSSLVEDDVPFVQRRYVSWLMGLPVVLILVQCVLWSAAAFVGVFNKKSDNHIGDTSDQGGHVYHKLLDSNDKDEEA